MKSWQIIITIIASVLLLSTGPILGFVVPMFNSLSERVDQNTQAIRDNAKAIGQLSMDTAKAINEVAITVARLEGYIAGAGIQEKAEK